MIEYSAADFDDLCRTAEVSLQLSNLEERRSGAVRHFWLYLAGSILLGIAVAATLIAYGWPVVGIILAIAVLVIGIILGTRPMSAAKADLKLPVLETLARKGGLEYLAAGFDPPVFPEVSRKLFGTISSYTFTDLFHGTDAHGKRFAVYEGTLTRRQGKNTHTVFTGQLYAWQRRSRGGGETLILPDKGLFNFIKPKGTDRVKFESDPAFEKKFEVYASHAAAALGLVGSEVRRTLVELRAAGRVFAYVGPDDVLVAIWGKNRFEPGSMFRSLSGQERVRAMFDDVCASLGVMRRLKAVLD